MRSRGTIELHIQFWKLKMQFYVFSGSWKRNWIEVVFDLVSFEEGSEIETPLFGRMKADSIILGGFVFC